MTNGEITKIEKFTGSSTTNPSIVTFTYDGKNNQFKNATGYSVASFIDETPDGFMQNVLNKVDGGFPSQSQTNTITYTSDNYPMTKTKIIGTNPAINFQFFY